MGYSSLNMIKGTTVEFFNRSVGSETTVECSFNAQGFFAEIILTKTGNVVTNSMIVPHTGGFIVPGSVGTIEITNPKSGVTYTIVRPDVHSVTVTPSSHSSGDTIVMYGIRCDMT